MRWRLSRAHQRGEQIWCGSVDDVEVAWVEVYQGDATQPVFFWSVMLGQSEAVGWDTSLAAAQGHVGALVRERGQWLMANAGTGGIER